MDSSLKVFRQLRNHPKQKHPVVYIVSNTKANNKTITQEGVEEKYEISFVIILQWEKPLKHGPNLNAILKKRLYLS